jgi:hypothetical protein
LARRRGQKLWEEFRIMINQNVQAAQGITLTPKCCDLMQRRGVTQEQKDTFLGILEKTQQDLDTQDPREILQSMAAAELEVLRKVHSLADPIDTAALDREGALNLLQQPGGARDINNDGFLRVGAAWTWTFPPPNAPAAVHQAWEEHTAGMTDMERMLAMSPFMAAELTGNARYDAQGNISGFYGPWDPEFKSIYNQPGFSYQNLVRGCLDNLEIGKAYIPYEQYLERKEFLEGFLSMLSKHSVR